MELISTIADNLFSWVLEDNSTEAYKAIFDSDVLSWVLIALFVVAIATAMIFYYGVAKIAANATKKNYIVVFLLGLLVLWLTNLIIVPTIVDDWSYAFDMDYIFVCLIDTVYYAILYEIVSLFAKDGSNAKHIHLLNCFS